jgi:Domain of unknown function (DUF4926)
VAQRATTRFHVVCVALATHVFAVVVVNGLVTACPQRKESVMIEELDQIVLTTDLPEYGLQPGDIGTVVLIHQGGAGYEVEFVALDGETLAGRWRS